MNEQPLLSVLMPVLNESATLDSVLDAVLAVPLALEVVLVDDGSTDTTWDIMQRYSDGKRVRAYRHETNRGKGAAVSTALEHARGEVVIIQDADLEYNPMDYVQLLQPIQAGRADVVFGTRTFTSHTAFSYWYVLGNRMVTLATNVLYNVYLSDVETCYKLLPRDAAMALQLEARGFEIDPEMTAKLIRMGYRIYEVPVEYAARSREEGKKLTAKDGVKALQTLLRYRRWRPSTIPESRRRMRMNSALVGSPVRSDRSPNSDPVAADALRG